MMGEGLPTARLSPLSLGQRTRGSPKPEPIRLGQRPSANDKG